MNGTDFLQLGEKILTEAFVFLWERWKKLHNFPYRLPRTKPSSYDLKES